MRQMNVFRNLASDGRLGLYTKETSRRIPESPGCYAWLLPLWLYREDIDALMQIVGELLSYDRNPEKEVEASFTWESVRLRVRRISEARPSKVFHSTWKCLLADDIARQALQRILLEASLLMPPLYVGRTGNLKRRYLQHTKGSSGKNDFHSRFTAHVANLKLKISVSDLLFACIRTPKELSLVLEKHEGEEKELSGLIEQMLMQFCHPPFNLK